MCDIGKRVEIIDVEPLALPAPLRKEDQPKQEPVAVPVEVPVAETALAEKS
jgi:hypothetical protein